MVKREYKMRHILKFIAWKLTTSDFWFLVLGSLAMYVGYQVRSNMRETIWKSYQSGGPLKTNYFKGIK